MEIDFKSSMEKNAFVKCTEIFLVAYYLSSLNKESYFFSRKKKSYNRNYKNDRRRSYKQPFKHVKSRSENSIFGVIIVKIQIWAVQYR